MDLTLCAETAFGYYRIPSQYLGLYPPVESDVIDRRLVSLKSHPIFQDLLTPPLHRAVQSTSHRGSRILFKSHLISQELPPGSFRETEHGFVVASPELTLLNLATSVSRVHLLMAAYEFCGSFAVFSPCERAEAQLNEAFRHRLLPQIYGWERVGSTKGEATSLWKREPLVTVENLRRYVDQASGLRGVKALRWVTDRLTGVTASPFEVEASILLSLPRKEGGLGLTVQNNVRIPLSKAAQTLYGRTCCYADILLESQTDSRGVVFECQGRSVHDSEAAGISDSDRATALTRMGYDVILVTHSQIKHERSFAELAKLLYDKIGIPYTPKTARELEAERLLRNELFIDWETLV